MHPVPTLLGAFALLVVGVIGGLVNTFAMGFMNDDCGGPDERRWRAGGQPQVIALVAMPIGILVAVGLALAPLVVDGGPAWYVAGLVLAGSVLLPLPFVAVIGSIPVRRRRRGG